MPDTLRDFYLDTNMKKFDAVVLKCIKLDEEIRSTLESSNEVTGLPTHGVIPDRTLFGPEGGWQLDIMNNRQIPMY